MLHLCIHQNFHNFATKCDWTRELKTKQQVQVGIDRTLKGAMSPHTHARANENRLEKVGPSFSSSVRDFGRLFLSV